MGSISKTAQGQTGTQKTTIDKWLKALNIAIKGNHYRQDTLIEIEMLKIG